MVRARAGEPGYAWRISLFVAGPVIGGGLYTAGADPIVDVLVVGGGGAAGERGDCDGGIDV